MRRLILLGATLLLGACASTEPVSPTTDEAAERPAVPFSETWVGQGLGAVVDFVADPVAANWEVRPIKLAEDRFRLELRMKRLHQGGDGEAYSVFERQAQAIADHAGYAHFAVVSYQEGLNSNWIAQRVARGEITLSH